MNKETGITLRSADRVNDSTLDRIWKYYYEQSTEIKLKPKEEEIRKRLVNIWGHLADILTDRQAIQAHIKWCEDQGYSVKETIAYEDLKYAKLLFGDRTKQSKAAMRAIMSEVLIKSIKTCVQKGKHMSATRLIREYNELNDLKNPNDIDPKLWKPITIKFDSDPETLKKQMAEIRKRTAEANAVDVQHEDVS